MQKVISYRCSQTGWPPTRSGSQASILGGRPSATPTTPSMVTTTPVVAGTSRAVRTVSGLAFVTVSRPIGDPRISVCNAGSVGPTTRRSATIVEAAILGVGAAVVGTTPTSSGVIAITSIRGSSSRGSTGVDGASPASRSAIRGIGRVVRCPCLAFSISGSCPCPVVVSPLPAGCRKVTGRRSGRSLMPRGSAGRSICSPTDAVMAATAVASIVSVVPIIRRYGFGRAGPAFTTASTRRPPRYPARETREVTSRVPAALKASKGRTSTISCRGYATRPSNRGRRAAAGRSPVSAPIAGSIAGTCASSCVSRPMVSPMGRLATFASCATGRTPATV